ncbi:uncharacterized protein LOC6549221 [Drosophila erecta]|uniref:uncharacterized protein LOC6549221 n=1 Tax=Drosophila erecta TaxID=7220 RepID=UPI0001780841|nr:uncharacterized protein LOC6549221 [Drosophila erecta]
MAEKNRSNDLSQNEADPGDSALNAAGTKKDMHFQGRGNKSRKTSSEINRKRSKACERTFKTGENPKKPKSSRNFETKNISGKVSDVSQAGTSRNQDGESLTITIDKGTKGRLQTVLKLLDLLEGKYDSDSECSMDSKSGSVKRSSRRLQAMQDISHRDFMGLCRDCRARCRSCGRRPSAVLMAKRRRY